MLWLRFFIKYDRLTWKRHSFGYIGHNIIFEPYVVKSNSFELTNFHTFDDLGLQNREGGYNVNLKNDLFFVSPNFGAT